MNQYKFIDFDYNKMNQYKFIDLKWYVDNSEHNSSVLFVEEVYCFTYMM